MQKEQGLSTKLWIENKDIPHKAVTEVNVAIKKFKLKKSELQRIQRFLKEKRLPWDVVISAVWGLLLSRLSTSDYIFYGTATLAGARIAELKLQNPISLIQCNINKSLTTKKLLQKTGAQLIKKSASKNKALPEECRYLLLVKSEVAGKKATEAVNFIRFSLVLCVDKKSSDLFSLHYNTTHFSDTAIDSLSAHLTLLLQTIIDHYDEPVADLPILTKDEQINILGKWKRPDYPFNVPRMPDCMHELFMQQAKQRPASVAVTHNDTTIDYQTLDTLSTLLAIHLIEKGVISGDRICVLMERSPTWIIAFLAVLKTGAIYVPINPKFPDNRLTTVLRDSQPKYILVNEMTRIPSSFHEQAMIVSKSTYKVQADKNLVARKSTVLPTVDAEQIAYIMYTSGTTGTPKGVMIKHRSLTNLIAWYIGLFKINANDKASQFGSQGFDAHICEIAPFLSVGASLHIVDDNTKLTPSLFLQWLKNNEITVCDLTTAYAQMLLALSWPAQIKLRLIKIGGEMLTRYPSHALPFEVWNCYGPTETTIEATYFKLCDAGKTPQILNKYKSPPIGKPIANSVIYVVDKYMQPVPIGVAGELLIGGEPVSAGYLNQPELTNERFIADPYDSTNPYKLYRTGDLVRWLNDGNLEFIGRADNQVKIRGYRIELGGIENMLAQHPDVNETIVIINENMRKEKSIIAYVVPDFDKRRYLYQERCLVSLNNHHFLEALTEDISKGGIALSGITETMPIGSAVKINVSLPGMATSKDFPARLIWQQANRCGFTFDVTNEDKAIIAKSIDYYLSTHNITELILSGAAKRNLRNALKKKLPEYMIPSMLITLTQFPLTFSGKIDVKALPPPKEFEQLLQKQYIAPKTDTEKKLTCIWMDLLHKDTISMSDNFFDLGGSSLTAAELSIKIMQSFNTTMPAKILFDLSYIPILAEYIDTKGEKYTSHTIIQEEIQRDSALPEYITPTNKLHINAKSPKNILLTGAGGFLGVYFLREFLKSTNAKIYCLIRKGEFDTAAKRLMASIHNFKLGDDVSLNDKRIIAIQSDISYDNFGLTPDHYNSLAEKIDSIYHCGAQVNIMASYNKLRSSNVLGTLEVIKFATTHTDKPIHYISSLSSAYRKNEVGLLAEIFPDGNYEELFGGYAISKWVSERLLTEAKNRGLPISIYRSGYISGQASNGICNLNDALFMLIKGCIQLGFAPAMNEKITILPVDYVSQAIIKIAFARPTESSVYHIDHPTGIMWSDLVAWLNNYGYRIQIITMKQWQEKLLNITQENAIFPFLPYYLGLPENQPVLEVSVDNTTSILKGLNLPYPIVGDELLTVYFDYMRHVDFLPPPNRLTQPLPHKNGIKIDNE